MYIKSHIDFIPDADIEAKALLLFERYCREIEPVTDLPVPVEKIADFLLELGIEWGTILDTDKEKILAYIDPESKTIKFNERHQDFFDEHMGTYQFTLAHELGHYKLHLLDGALESLPLVDGQGRGFLCRGLITDRREWQANRFASYLLMPSNLLRPMLMDIDLLHWPNLYRLAEICQVSISALTIRLEGMGALFVADGGVLHRSKEEAAGQLTLF